MHHIIGYVFIGAVLGGVSATKGNSKGRPLLRKVVKGGIVAKRRIENYRVTVVSEAQKLVEEARAELDHPATEHKA